MSYKQKQSGTVLAKAPLRIKQKCQQHYAESIFVVCGSKVSVS